MARIGLLSDSHGRAATTRLAVETLLHHEVELLVHLGDVGAIEVLDALAVNGPDGDQIEARVIFGNTDWDITSLTQYARRLDIHVDHPVGRLPVEGGELVFCHGDVQTPITDALAQGVKYLCHGHTHRLCDTRRGTTRVINPGALFRARRYTVALLNTAADTLDFHDLGK